ncbi:hypothetical protein OsccyDRAFT_0846 [Leptolyngbyaceae cyanobacterium JSC-12]|nr:hypothetical protein OsccyDRAFT_0846 [Leptolyngbyaceae cyanobacterium JSC-12]
MKQPSDQPVSSTTVESDPIFAQQVERLHSLTVGGRWVFAGFLWLTVGTLSIWGLRYPISLMLEYFTWASVYYGLHFHPLPALGLFFCVAVTTSILVWQSRNILFGLPKRDRRRLEEYVLRIRKQGPSHPLWKYVCQESGMGHREV